MVKGCAAVTLSMILSSGFALAAPTPADDCSCTFSGHSRAAAKMRTPADGAAYQKVCDVNRDGACNIGDALRLAQCDVGLISCTFPCPPFLCQ